MSSPDGVPSRLDAIATRWTLLRQAHGDSARSAGEARGALVLRYLPAVRRYVGAMMRDDEAVEDVTQDVVVRLMAGDFAGADPDRGRFRDLLKVAIRNMVRNQWARQKRRRTVAVEVADLPGGESSEAEDADWLAAWRGGVLELAWNALRQHERHHPGTAAHTLLRLRMENPDDTSEQLAEKLSRKLGKAVRPDALRQKLRRARLQFVDLLITEIGNSLAAPTPERIEDELIAMGLLEFVRDLLPAERGKGR